MKTIANFGLMDVISEDNKDTINFNLSSGKVTFILAFNGEEVAIERAYWRHLNYGGAIEGDQAKLWKIFNEKIKKKLN